MTDAELKQLIREAIRDVLVPPRRALVIFSGGLLGFDEAIEGLRALAGAGVQLDYLQTPSAERILDQDRIAALGMREVRSKMVEEHDLLLAPTLTANLAAKVAHGVADCLASNLFSEFIMSNRLVVASRTAVCPDGAAKQAWFPRVPSAYADLLRANLRALASFGVRLAPAHALARTAIAAWDRRDRAHQASLATELGVSVAELIAAAPSPAVGTQPAATPRAATGGPRLVAPGSPDAPASGRTATPAQPAVGSRVVVCDCGLISQQVVQQLPDGAELRIRRGALVTALARDSAAARSIRISQEA